MCGQRIRRQDLVIAIALILAGCVGPRADDQWIPRVGDSATDSYRNRDSGDTWTVTERIEALESISVRGNLYNSFRVKETTTSPDAAGATTWISESGTKLLRVDPFGDGTYLDFDPPCDANKLKFKVGESADTLCRAYLNIEDEVVQVTFHAKQDVLGREAITVPSGTYHAFRVWSEIEIDLGAVGKYTMEGTDWVSPETCGGLSVKGESKDSDNVREAYENISYACPR